MKITRKVNSPIVCLIVLLLILAVFPLTPAHGDHFPLPRTSNLSASFLISLKINDSIAAPGDEVAFYDPQGVLCGHLIIGSSNQEYFPANVYGDDTTTGIDEGASSGDILAIKVWDAVNRLEYSGNYVLLSAGTIQTNYYFPSSIPPIWYDSFASGKGYVLNISTTFTKGDINHDARVDMKDALTILQLLSGEPVTEPIYHETGVSLGLTDIIFILQEISLLRPWE